MKIKLTYGDGFTGRNYFLEIDKEYFNLIGTTLGGSDEENNARNKAKEILKEKGINFDIDNIPFQWDGCM
jgi:hypothetical protein